MHITKRNTGESARDFALRLIKDNIIRLELEPGSMVSEHELAARLGLSRGPVREALMELSKVKMVEVLPQRGSFIAPVDYDLVEEARFMRETLEIAVTERCCHLGVSPEHLYELEENIRLQRFYLENQNIDKLWEMDNEFHRLLFLSAGVMRVHTFMKSMQVHFDRVRAMGLTALRKSTTVDEHSLILQAITNGDAQTAKELMHRHLTSYQVDRQAVCEKYPQYIKK